jgi:pilus assembly protein Flp/PilA
MLNLVEKFTPAVEADMDDAGLTMVEYAIAGGLVAVGCVAAFTALGGAITNKIGDITTELNK